MTASKIRGWIQDGETVPDWVNSQGEDTQEHLQKYWRSTIANNADETLKNRTVALRQFAEFLADCRR